MRGPSARYADAADALVLVLRSWLDTASIVEDNSFEPDLGEIQALKVSLSAQIKLTPPGCA